MARSKTKKTDIDWNSFVQQSEPKVEDDLAETTKNYIYLVKQNFLNMYISIARTLEQYPFGWKNLPISGLMCYKFDDDYYWKGF
jgi:hypothetical protein